VAPLVDEAAVLIEDLDAVVLAVADEEPTARVHRDRVRLAQLTASGTLRTPLLYICAVLAEFHHPVVLAVPVAVGDEDVAGRGGDDDVGGLIEGVAAGAGDAGLAERHQDGALLVELEDLVALAIFAARVGEPQVALAIDRRAVREDEHPRPPRLQQLSVRVVLQDLRL